MGALIGAMSAYIGSLGVLFPIILLVITQGIAVFGNYLVYGFFAIMFFGFYEGYFNQNRLKRLVKEHKDYTSEFDEITDLIERKRIYEFDNFPINREIETFELVKPSLNRNSWNVQNVEIIIDKFHVHPLFLGLL